MLLQRIFGRLAKCKIVTYKVQGFRVKLDIAGYQDLPVVTIAAPSDTIVEKWLVDKKAPVPKTDAVEMPVATIGDPLGRKGPQKALPAGFPEAIRII